MTNFQTTTRYQNTTQDFDKVNAEDPNQENGMAKELLYAQRMTEMLEEFAPEASEAVFLASRGQHIERWKIARSDYPNDRKGYLKWRTQLKIYHAERAGEIMQNHGYQADEIKKVSGLLKKQKLKTDTETQILEDVICLVFLKYYYADFLAKHSEEKIILILQKTRQKMTSKGWEKALTLSYSETELSLIVKAFPELQS